MATTVTQPCQVNNKSESYRELRNRKRKNGNENKNRKE